MQVDTPCANPFMLMMTPQKVLEAMKKSDGLRRLQHQVFHPLDSRPAFQGDAELAAFDEAIERASLVLPEGGSAPPA
ncbi:MAG: hypothetical protein Q8M93_05825 [Polaromonas sp.]|uniref:hypothetical protein n=1 Tax=Polaromonas sp. TaxID=1869339 RepID=UPI002730BC57|nr:hypothetical protein [Polaromonas sp.]MDP2448139.1 hypothetical protein [Polaromonas sp.]MDP3246467.1 hypothetical protein [Polaromonas sp.]MDP3756219.1 hypothetical protein [Polaromonas sp.]